MTYYHYRQCLSEATFIWWRNKALFCESGLHTLKVSHMIYKYSILNILNSSDSNVWNTKFKCTDFIFLLKNKYILEADAEGVP